jgi:hypothetical protein
MDLVFRKFPATGPPTPAPGEVFLFPRSAEDRDDAALARLVLDEGVDALLKGPGPTEHLVVDVATTNPTFDDLLAATFTRLLLENKPLPPGCKAFADYAAVARKGHNPSPNLPIEASPLGIYLAIRNAAGADPDLTDPPIGARFRKDWERMASRILQVAEAGQDPFTTPLFATDSDFAEERAFLVRDHEVYRQDVARGERWQVTIPGEPPTACPGLLLRRPISLLFKFWSRDDPEAPDGKGYLFLAVDWGETDEGNRLWVFSTDPVHRLSLRPLAPALQEAEAALDPVRAQKDPWFDGVPFRHTLIATPKGGTWLSEEKVLQIVRKWVSARPVRPHSRRRYLLAGSALLAACVACLAVGVFIIRRDGHPPPPCGLPPEHKVVVTVDGRPVEAIARSPLKEPTGAIFCKDYHVTLPPGDDHPVKLAEENRFTEERPVKLRITLTGRDLDLIKKMQKKVKLISVGGAKEPATEWEAGEEKIEMKELAAEFHAVSNEIYFSVNNTSGRSLKVTIQFSWRDDPEKIRVFVLAIGVSKYPHYQENQQLPEAVKDATALFDMFEKQKRLFHEVNCKLLPEKGQGLVTRKDVLEKGLSWLVKENPGEHDLVIITLSGHGKKDKKGNYVFLPSDDEPDNDNPETTGVSWRQFADVLTDLKCHVVVVLDTCHSGAAASGFRDVNPKPDLEQKVKSALDAFSTVKRGIVILAACRSDQRSFEHKDWGHGALTLAILECLAGKQKVKPFTRLRLPRAGDVIYLEDVIRYAEQRVAQLVKGGQAVVPGARGISPRQIPVAVLVPNK